MKEKTCVCIGIFLILAVLCSCALFYGMTGAADVAIRAGSVDSPAVMAMLLSDSADASPLSDAAHTPLSLRHSA